MCSFLPRRVRLFGWRPNTRATSLAIPAISARYFPGAGGDQVNGRRSCHWADRAEEKSRRTATRQRQGQTVTDRLSER